MNSFGSFGKLLMAVGALIFCAGLLLARGSNIPWLGQLPGDIILRRKNVVFYFPLATSLLLSILISLIAWLFNRR